jgi:hypothetical protein
MAAEYNFIYLRIIIQRVLDFEFEYKNFNKNPEKLEPAIIPKKNILLFDEKVAGLAMRGTYVSWPHRGKDTFLSCSDTGRDNFSSSEELQ